MHVVNLILAMLTKCDPLPRCVWPKLLVCAWPKLLVYAWPKLWCACGLNYWCACVLNFWCTVEPSICLHYSLLPSPPAAKYGGSVSAEHGIGIQKPQYIYHSKSREAVEMMRRVKKVFDPKVRHVIVSP